MVLDAWRVAPGPNRLDWRGRDLVYRPVADRHWAYRRLQVDRIEMGESLSENQAKGATMKARKQKGHHEGSPDARPLETASPRRTREVPMTDRKSTVGRSACKIPQFPRRRRPCYWLVSCQVAKRKNLCANCHSEFRAVRA